MERNDKGAEASLKGVSKVIDGGTEIVDSSAKFVDSCSNLVDSTRKFCDNATRLVDECIEKVNSLEHIKINYESEAKSAFEDVRAVAYQAFIFVDKVDDIFYHGKDTEGAKEALHERNDMQPLMELLEMLLKCMAEAEKEYIVFEECYKKASQSCLNAAESCKHQSQNAKVKKVATGIVGGSAAGGAVAGGAALVATSIIVGIFTAGIGAPIVLGVGAAGAGVAAAVGAVATGGIAHHFNKAQKSFTELANIFDDMWLATLHMKQEIDTIRLNIKRIEHSVKDVEFRRANSHSRDAICRALDRQQEKFTKYRKTTASFRGVLKNKKESLEQGLKNIKM